jgi:hypothetical protein
VDSDNETGSSIHIALMRPDSGVRVEIASASGVFSRIILFRLISTSRGAFLFHAQCYVILVKVV